MAKLTPPKKESVLKTVDIEEAIQKVKSVKPLEQTPPDAIKPLQLKIPESKKNEFKAYCAMRGQSMNTIFLDMFEKYKA